MFDIAWSELALIGAVALVVIGPKDLPKVMRTAGQWTRKARLLAGEFQRNFDDMVRQAELEEVRQQVQSVNPTALKSHVENMIGAGEISNALKIDPEQRMDVAAVAAAASLKPVEGAVAAAVPPVEIADPVPAAVAEPAAVEAAKADVPSEFAGPKP